MLFDYSSRVLGGFMTYRDDFEKELDGLLKDLGNRGSKPGDGVCININGGTVNISIGDRGRRDDPDRGRDEASEARHAIVELGECVRRLESHVEDVLNRVLALFTRAVCVAISVSHCGAPSDSVAKPAPPALTPIPDYPSPSKPRPVLVSSHSVPPNPSISRDRKLPVAA